MSDSIEILRIDTNNWDNEILPTFMLEFFFYTFVDLFIL